MSAPAGWPNLRARRPSFALGDSASAGGDASRPLAGAGQTSSDLVDPSTEVHAGDGCTSMAALVPLGADRSRSRRHRGTTLEEGQQPLNTGVCSESPAHQKGNKTCWKRKSRNTDTPPTDPIPELSDEIVLDILARLPVKSLLRCKSVCKGWRAIITDPFFVRAHLQRSASGCEQDPCLVITPVSIDNHDVSNHFPFYQWQQGAFPFYQWQQGASMATLMQDMDFGSNWNSIRCVAQCDGLVLVTSDIRLHLFNPATRETITLPDRDSSRQFCSISRSPGLGLDPRTDKHKVVRTFYRSIDPDTGKAEGMGMEVFTVSGNSNGGRSAWREIKDDLPYPAKTCGTGVAVNGFLFWRLFSNHHDRGLLRLSLADETFGITRLPDSMGPYVHIFGLYVLHGVLCMSVYIRNDTYTMWMLPIQEDGGQGQTWERCCTLELTCMCRPLALLPGGRMMLYTYDKKICLYDMSTTKLTTVCELDRMKYQGRRAQTWENNIVGFYVHLYTESLVRIGV